MHAHSPPTPQSIVRVKAFFSDASGNTGPQVYADAIIDCKAPTMIGMKLSTAPSSPPTPSSISLMWTGEPKDGGAGVTGYMLAYKPAPPKSNPPLSCKPGQGVTVINPVPGGTGSDANPLVVTGLTTGTEYRFRLCAVDFAGNVASGITAKASTTV